MNAKDFTFPDGPLVLYLLNPFGAATMPHVLDNLESSLKRPPRPVVVVLLWPRCGDQVARIEGMRLYRTTQHHQIFEAHASSPDDRYTPTEINPLKSPVGFCVGSDRVHVRRTQHDG